MKFFKHHPKILGAIIFLLLIISGIVYVNIEHYQDKRNIFDEIYFVEKNAYPNINGTLNSIKGIEAHSYRDVDGQFKGIAGESYDKVYLPKGYENVSFSFSFKSKGSLLISFDKIISQNLSLRIYDRYLVQEKKMTRSLSFVTEQKKVIDDSKQISDLRKQYNITDKELEKYNKEILNDFFLRDWCQVYDSKYAPNDWGEVKVEKGWE